jgi:DNA-binding MarR family transcriptional regulator
MVDRLVEKRVLQRKQSRKDRRKVVVTIAPEAVHSLDALERTLLASFVDLVRRVGPEIAGKWCEVLRAVKEVQDMEMDTGTESQKTARKKPAAEAGANA